MNKNERIAVVLIEGLSPGSLQDPKKIVDRMQLEKKKQQGTKGE